MINVKCCVQHHFLKDSMLRRPGGEVCAKACPDRARGGLDVWSLQHHRRWHHHRLVFHLQQLPPRRLMLISYNSLIYLPMYWLNDVICIKLFNKVFASAEKLRKLKETLWSLSTILPQRVLGHSLFLSYQIIDILIFLSWALNQNETRFINAPPEPTKICETINL